VRILIIQSKIKTVEFKINADLYFYYFIRFHYIIIIIFIINII